MLNHWWRQLVRRFGYRLNAPRGGKSQKRPHGYRPRLETLEDRTLMTAGILDAAFSGDGLVTTNVIGNDDFAGGVAVQANGKIVVVGETVSTNGDLDIVVMRYNSNGTLDTSFGFGGRVTTGLGPGSEDAATGVVIDAAGRIVVGGFTDVNGDSDFVLVRYLSSGALDSSFGTGGIVTTDFGGDDAITALALMDPSSSTSNIVAVGNTSTGLGTSEFALAMYDTNGELDDGFDNGIDPAGTVTTDFGGDDDVAFAVAIDASGRIVVAGAAFDGTDNSFAIARYIASGPNSGDLDGDFSGGTVIVEFNGVNLDEVAQAIGFLSGDRIVVGGFAVNADGDEDFALAVLEEDGTFDNSFGVGGRVTSDIRDTEGNDIISALVVNTIGGQEGIVVVGSAFDGTFDDSEFVAARYLASGLNSGDLDLNFGLVTPGVVRTTFGVDSALATAVALDGLGRIVVAGYADMGGTAYDFAVARFLVNDPFSLTSINEDPGANPPSTLLSDILQGSFGAVAITGLNNTADGTWQYSTNGSTFINFGSVSEANARLLVANATTRIRFRPNANFNGEVSLTLVSWNQTAGTAGGVFDITQAPAAFGGDTVAATLTVIPVNDAPVLSTTPTSLILDGTPAIGGPVADSVTSATGATVASIVGNLITDVDGDPAGIAITAVTGNAATQGVWQFSTDDGGTWTNFGTTSTTAGLPDGTPLTVGTVSATSALMLRDVDRIRYVFIGVPNRTVSFTFRAWDGTVGGAGTKQNPTPRGGSGAFSTAIKVANVPVVRNIAPLLAAGTPTFTPVDVGDGDPAGNTVASLLGNSVTDSPSDGRGVAIIAAAGTGTNNANGVWQFSTDGGTTWINFGTNSTAGSTAAQTFGTVAANRALLLDENDLVRFLPSATFTALTATTPAKPSITFRAWDQTTGAVGGPNGLNLVNLSATASRGGTTAFSTATQIARVLVNSAPEFNTVDNDIGPTNEDTTFTVNTNTVVTPSDSAGVTTNQLGFAVIGVTGNGTWSYSNTTTAAFTNISSSVSPTTAKLIAANGRLRFSPAKNFNGTATITVVAWDRTAGALNGTFNLTTLNADTFTAFSNDGTFDGEGVSELVSETLTLTIDAVNDAPVLSGSKNLTKISPSITDLQNIGNTVSTFASPFITDPDGNFKGIAITAATGTAAQGHWEFSLDGGSNWTNFPATVSATNAVLLPPSARVRFVPLNNTITGTFTLTFRAWDGTAGTAGIGTTAGLGTALSSATRTSSIQVAL